MSTFPARRKYGNTKVVVDGMTFDSKREARRWGELSLMAKVGGIRDLRRQVQYELIPAQWIDGKCAERACTLTVDFVYEQDGRTVAEDAKGYANDRWPIKRKLMLKVFGIRVREV